jgi:hypothetical protein
LNFLGFRNSSRNWFEVLKLRPKSRKIRDFSSSIRNLFPPISSTPPKPVTESIKTPSLRKQSRNRTQEKNLIR